jgi:hypothetical protein
MKTEAIACAALLFASGLSFADDKTSQTAFYPNQPGDPRTWWGRIIFQKIDFNNNTLGEMVDKLNALIRSEAKGSPKPELVFDFKGWKEPAITQALGRKVVHWFPMTNVPFGEALAYVCQLTSCDYRTEGSRILIRPSTVYNPGMSDVSRIVHHAHSQAAQ